MKKWNVVNKPPKYSVHMLTESKKQNLMNSQEINNDILSLIEKHNAKYFKSGKTPTIQEQLVVAINNFLAMIQLREYRDGYAERGISASKAVNILENTCYVVEKGKKFLKVSLTFLEM